MEAYVFIYVRSAAGLYHGPRQSTAEAGNAAGVDSHWVPREDCPCKSVLMPVRALPYSPQIQLVYVSTTNELNGRN